MNRPESAQGNVGSGATTKEGDIAADHPSLSVSYIAP